MGRWAGAVGGSIIIGSPIVIWPLTSSVSGHAQLGEAVAQAVASDTP